MKQKMLDLFEKVFGDTKDVNVYFAPGRVNLIGEHTDYNGGHVFPCALSIGTYAAARKRNDEKLRFYSENFEKLGVMESAIENLVCKEEDNWTNYPKGVIWAMKKKGYDIPCGMDIVYFGNIPNGSGLSSSASIEVLTGFVCRELFGLDVDNLHLALIGQYSENNFNGVNCGIMDQFAIAMGKKDQAMFLDTATLEYEYAPVKLDGYKIVILNTNKKRGLGDSKYNERRSQCEEALEKLKTVLDVKSLGDLTIKQFEENKAVIGDEVLIKRAKHAVYENQRTIQAVAALKENNIALFGQLINQSGDSLREDYEVTGIELDTLVEEARKQEGVIAARMTGAGFGGCAVSIVKNECVDNVIRSVGEAYKQKIGYAADFYVVEIGAGPEVLKWICRKNEINGCKIINYIIKYQIISKI